jgi:hypothetical protein
MGWSRSNQAQVLERRAHGVEVEFVDGAEVEARDLEPDPRFCSPAIASGDE